MEALYNVIGVAKPRAQGQAITSTEIAISNDLINQGGSMKLKDFLASWLEVKEQQIAQTTFKSYKFNVDRINKKLGGYALEKLKAFHVKQMINDLRKESLNLRFQKSSGQLEKTARIRIVRRQIARIKTIINNKEAGKK